MKFLNSVLLGAVLSLGITSAVFAAGASMQGKAENTAKGKEISGNTLTISLSGGEVKAAADTIHIVLNGAEWKSLSNEGRLAKGVNYEKISSAEIALHITPDEDMLSQGCTAVIPLNCNITKDLVSITATVKWGLREYEDREIAIAHCTATHSYLDGGVREHKTGDKIFKKGGSELDFNKLKIYIISHDTQRTQNKITITYDGAEWSDYGDEGKIETNHGTIRFEKLNSKTIRLKIDDLVPNLRQGYIATVPLSGTITGKGAIKAIVDYGVDDIPQSTVTFANCPDGEMSVKAVSADTPVNTFSRVSDIAFTDTSTRAYNNNSKIEFEISHAYHLAQTPTVVGEGKFADKCRVQINKDNDKKFTVYFSKIDSAETGSFTVKDIVVQCSEKSLPNTEAIKMTVSSDFVSDKIQVGKFTQGSADYKQGYTITAENPNAQANDKYAFLGKIKISDSSSAEYKKGARTEFSFDSSFKWFTGGKLPELNATGKFAGRCAFEYGEDAQKAYIVFTDDIPAQEGGTIEITNAVLEKSDTEEYIYVTMTAGLEGRDDTYITAKAAKFSSLLDKEPERTAEVNFTAAVAVVEPLKNANLYVIPKNVKP